VPFDFVGIERVRASEAPRVRAECERCGTALCDKKIQRPDRHGPDSAFGGKVFHEPLQWREGGFNVASSLRDGRQQLCC
jgi:hypothetical protein